MTQCSDYRALLDEEYARRRGRNPAYSYRAFARDLGISASYLSKLMSRQKMLAEDRAFRIASQLRWGERRTKVFVTLVRHEHVRSEPGKAGLEKELEGYLEEDTDFRSLEADHFAAISKWYHMAILALTTTDGFQSSPRKSSPAYLAKRLGITPLEAELAVDRLRRLRLVEVRDGCLVQTENHFFIKDDKTSEALRAYHRQILEKAIASIDGHSPPSRDISGSTIPMDPDRITEANEIIRKFRRKLMALMSTGPRKALYHLSIQLFRIDREIAETA